MKTHVRRQQHKKFKHQYIKQKEPPQKYIDLERSVTQSCLSRVSSYYPIVGHSVTRTELKYENVHNAQKAQKIRLQNTKQLEAQQKYRLGTISNIKLPGHERYASKELD